MRRLAQLREQIVAALLAADRDLFGEVGDDALPAAHAPRHRGAGPWLADRRHRRRHHVDEGLGDLVHFGPEIAAEERGRGEVERELFHRRIAQHLARLAAPLLDPRGDTGIELREIGLHRPRLERHRQRPAVQPVLVEIQHHQPAREQQPKDRSPAIGRGEVLGLVEQHQLVGLGAEQRDAGLAEHPAAIHRAIGRGHPLDLALGVGEHLKGAADDRPAFVAGNMAERAALRRRHRSGGKVGKLQRHRGILGFPAWGVRSLPAEV